MSTTAAQDSVVRRLDPRTGYDEWAAIYDTEENPLVSLEQPLFDALVGDVGGLEILDVGCGTGRHSLRLAERGAQVHAVDFADQMLARARAKPGAGEIQFVVHDLAELGQERLLAVAHPGVRLADVLEHRPAGAANDVLKQRLRPRVDHNGVTPDWAATGVLCTSSNCLTPR